MPLRTLKPRLRAKDTSTTPLPAKTADAHYVSVEHRAWRAAVLERAGLRCEHVNGHGIRCEVVYPARLYADHVRELRDGGARLDPANGQCLCSEHHTRKSNAARLDRWK